MEKAVLLPVVGTVVVLGLISVFALTKIPVGASLPMQWGFDGEPTWSAPRDLAVWLIPLIGVVVMIWSGAGRRASIAADPENVWPLYMTGAVLIAIHAVHLWFAVKHASS